MAKRKYVKKSAYWDNISKGKSQSVVEGAEDYKFPDLTFEFSGDGILEDVATARSARTSSSTSTKGATFTGASLSNRYCKISEMDIPYEGTKEGMNVQDAIELVQKCYYGFAPIKNVIDMMSEFANSSHFLEGGTKKARSFIDLWLKKIDINDFKDQWFREMFRSGNVPVIRHKEKLTKRSVNSINQKMSKFIKGDSVPVKYEIINPYYLFIQGDNSYLYPTYKIERRAKKNGGFGKKSYDELDKKNLIISFYKKQDYEPMAIPMVWPVLKDVNTKLELKELDLAINRTVENAILLITNGAKKEDGGVNQANIAAIQRLFEQAALGRVFVSDYTTKGEFLIPDLKKVLGKEKYEIINNDISEGLQNILWENSKYSDLSIKIKVLMERLKKVRTSFCNIMQSEINRVCADLGIRNPPEFKMHNPNVEDSNTLQRVATRLMELGIIVPEDGIEIIRSGEYPAKDSLIEKQSTYIAQREEGWFDPLIGGKNKNEQVPSQAGRPVGEKSSATMRWMNKINSFQSFADEYFKSKFQKQESPKAIYETVDKIIASKDFGDWESEFIACMDNFDLVDELIPRREIKDLVSEKRVSDRTAAIIFYSKGALNTICE